MQEKKIKFREKEIEIENLENYDFSKAQITIFAAGSEIAKEWATKAERELAVQQNTSNRFNIYRSNVDRMPFN